MNTQQLGWLKRIDEAIDTLAVLRAEIAGDEGEVVGVPVIESQTAGEDVVLRGLRFLKPFYDAPGRSLHKDAARQAALDAGYDPRGTAGFYTGNGSLLRVGDYRILTDVGAAWYEANAPRYGDELGLDEV